MYIYVDNTHSLAKKEEVSEQELHSYVQLMFSQEANIGEMEMDGILALWKEKGMTSHDCVFRLRKILQMKKIGHGGTLDPDAEGVLPICIGKGVKVIEYLVDSGKTYEGEVTLGFSTTTEDISGEIVAESRMSSMLATSEIDEAMKVFVGEITQIPPMYSAVKVNGKRLYEYAREGISVSRPKRKVNILSFDRISEPIFNEKEGTQSFRFCVECGKGTYIRTLAVDLGKRLGLESHLSNLTRIKSAGLNYYEAHTLGEIEEAVKTGIFEEFLFPIEIGIADFPQIDLNDELYQKVKNGARLVYSELGLISRLNSQIALFYRKKLISIYQNHPEKEGILKPSKVF